MTPQERAKAWSACLALLRRVSTEVVRYWIRQPGGDANALALVTWSIVTLNVVVFAGMLFGSGTLDDPETLVAWGGNFGPRTTNAEWWRLVTAQFVHAGPLHLLATLAGLIQVGRFTERVVGR